MSPNLTLFSISAILLVSTDDRTRLFAKYYSSPHPPLSTAGQPTPQNYPGASAYPTLKDQKAFEKGLYEKSVKTNADVILYDNKVVVFKTEGDLMMYVVGGPEENEILLFSVVLCLRDALSILLKSSTDKRSILEHYDLVSLCIDEIVDDGIILETDPVIVASRVSRPPAQDNPLGGKGIELSEQGLLNVWEFGKMKLAERMRQGL
ncbi:Golgi-to-ER vesicle coat component [Varicellaria rhodocarpa]|nr:Golgi-to-ER vesicle coat component [Varicellaria rhodocarpa]